MPRSIFIFIVAGLASTPMACGDGGSSRVPFDGPPEIVEFRASSDAVDPRAAVLLSWETRNARVVTVGAMETTYVSSFDASGTVMSEPLRTTTTFVLTARGDDSSVTSSVTVRVQWPEPVIESFSVAARGPIVGSFLNLEWSTRDTELVRVFRDDVQLHEHLNPGLESTPGMIQSNITAVRAVYRLEASNPDGVARSELFVTASDPRVIQTFTVSPRSFFGRAVTATVTWSTTNATRTELTSYAVPRSEFPGTPAGSYNFTMFEETELVLTAFDETGEVAVSAIFVEQPFREVEPNDFMGQNINLRGAVRGEISSPADIDVFYFPRMTNGRLRASVFDVGGSGCAFDNLIVVSSSDGQSVRERRGGALAPSGGACAVAELQSLPGEGRDVSIEVRSENGEIGPYLLVAEEN